jgi:hypothetical protein
MKLETIGLAALVALAGIPVACAAAPPESASKPQNEAASGEVATLAQKTLSDHLSAPRKDIEVVSITPREWRDSSLGCPKPDRGYMQVISQGHLAVLSHAGQTYNVHIAGKRAFVCQPTVGWKEKEVSLAPLVTIVPAARLQELAREDLAKRLGVPLEDIQVAQVHRMDWSDESLGCPQPGKTYAFKRSKGHLFELQHRSRTYRYHADMQRVMPCPPIEGK